MFALPVAELANARDGCREKPAGRFWTGYVNQTSPPFQPSLSLRWRFTIPLGDRLPFSPTSPLHPILAAIMSEILSQIEILLSLGLAVNRGGPWASLMPSDKPMSPVGLRRAAFRGAAPSGCHQLLSGPFTRPLTAPPALLARRGVWADEKGAWWQEPTAGSSARMPKDLYNACIKGTIWSNWDRGMKKRLFGVSTALHVALHNGIDQTHNQHSLADLFVANLICRTAKVSMEKVRIRDRESVIWIIFSLLSYSQTFCILIMFSKYLLFSI